MGIYPSLQMSVYLSHLYLIMIDLSVPWLSVPHWMWWTISSRFQIYKHFSKGREQK
jgi:hypothetical protein